MIDCQIRSVKLQFDSMTEVAKENAMGSIFQNEIIDLKNELKNLILESAVKRRILDKILTIKNDKCRDILTRYIEIKTVSQIAREMFMSRQGVHYHLDVGEKAISSLI